MHVTRNAVAAICVAAGLGTIANAGTTWYVDDDNCPGPGTGTIDNPFCRIQDGIDAAAPGDAVFVEDGIYFGVGNVNLTYNGKDIVVRSLNGAANCIINCTESARGFLFVTGETSDALVDGFTITSAIADFGAGMLVSGASPTVQNCVFSSSFASIAGGGVHNEGGSPAFINCEFLYCSAGVYGGGLSSAEGSPTIIGGAFLSNASFDQGGGAWIGSEQDTLFEGVHFEANLALVSGGGAFLTRGSDSAGTAHLLDCVFDGNGVTSPDVPTYGGAIVVDDAQLVMEGGAVTGNLVPFAGGGIFGFLSDIALDEVLFHLNGSLVAGGALWTLECNVEIDSCAFTGNAAGALGGATGFHLSNAVIDASVFEQNQASESGGAIYDLEASVQVTEGTFVYNDAGQSGAGIYAQDAELFVIGSVFEENTAMAATFPGGGGAIAVWDDASAVVVSSEFRWNACFGGGGAIGTNFSELSVFESLFYGNEVGPSNLGGAINTRWSSARINGSLFDGNHAETGGAIRTTDGDVIIDRCTFAGNTASTSGGGLDAGQGAAGTLQLISCDFVGNFAGLSGGGSQIFQVWSTVANCLYNGNYSGDRGGGSTFALMIGSANVANCTWVNNEATTGGGVYVQFHPTLIRNSILWNNTPPQIVELDPASTTVMFSTIQGGWTGAGSDNKSAYPMFVDADGADNVPGNEDDDCRLLAGSPCVDAGMNGAVPSDAADLDGDGDVTEPLPQDLDGLARFVDDPATADTGAGVPPYVDMGAFERQVLPPCPADLNGDGMVNGADLGLLLGAWGPCVGCPEDLTSDGTVDGADLGLLLGAWGPC